LAFVAFTPQILVCDRHARAWPADPGKEPGPAEYGPADEAFTTAFPFDAHTAAYSLPMTEHRLRTQALAMAAPKMVLIIFDIDTPGHVPITEAWWAKEEPKIRALIRARGRCYAWTSRNGYKIAYGIEPIEIGLAEPACHPLRWTASYHAWCDEIAAEFQIIADKNCADWTRLYRLPRVNRDGEDVVPLHEVGEPDRMSAWRSPLLSADDPRCVPPPPRDVPVALAAPVPEERLFEAAEALAAAWPDRGRHYSTLMLCGVLAGLGWSEEAIADFVIAVCGLAGDDDVAHHEKCARDACDRAARGETLAGWPTVAEYLATGRDGVHDPLRDPIAEAAVLTARRALGDAPPEETWAGAIARLKAEAPPPPPPSDDEIRATLQAEKMRLGRRANADAQRDAELLKQLKKGAGRVMLSPETDADQIRALAGAVARHAPDGTTAQQVASVLGSIVPNPAAIESVAAEALAAAHTPDEATSSSVEGFEVDSETGKPKPTQGNIRLSLGLLGVALQHNLLSGRDEAVKDGQTFIIEDQHVRDIWLGVDVIHKYRPAKEFFLDVVGNIAMQNEYHPVHDYLNGLSWDGEERIDTWLIRLAGAPDTRFVRAVSRLVLVAACRRVRQPGAKFDELLILESPTQGTDKSTAIKSLCPNTEWFGEHLPLHADPKRLIEATAGKWIVEAPELAGLARGEVDDLKALLSWAVDEARLSYGRLTSRHPRQWVAIGTINETEYLRDTTGNRRFWPVRIQRFDIPALVAERDQLWAEASERERAGESIRLDRDLWSDAAKEQEDREEIDAYAHRLAETLGKLRGWLAIADAWKVCLGRATSQTRDPNPAEVRRIGQNMRKLGWLRRRRRMEDGSSPWFYWQGEPEDEGYRINLKTAGFGGGDFTAERVRWGVGSRAPGAS